MKKSFLNELLKPINLLSLLLALAALILSIANLYYTHRSITVLGSLRLDLLMISHILVGVFLVIYGIKMIHDNKYKPLGYFLLLVVFLGIIIHVWPHSI